MRANTEYSGYSAASPVIQWFWEVAQGFSKEDKARLLQFVTGTSKVLYSVFLKVVFKDFPCSTSKNAKPHHSTVAGANMASLIVRRVLCISWTSYCSFCLTFVLS